MNNIKDFFDYLAGSQVPFSMTVMVMLIVLLFLALLIYVPMLTKKIFPKFGYAKKT